MTTNITLNCTDQTLTVSNAPAIASGGINEDTVAFTFCNKWDDFTKTAIFYRSLDSVYCQLLDENDSCTIPKEVLLNSGVFYIGVFGVNGNTRRTSSVVKYTVTQGAITEDLQTPDPTPDVYSQIIARLSAVENRNDFDIHGLTAEIEIADADEMPFYDTSETAQRKTPWSNIKAKLKTYFDTLYAVLNHNHTKSDITDFPSIPEAIQYSTMPTAIADNAGDIVQYTGATDATYTNGYFYKCESAGYTSSAFVAGYDTNTVYFNQFLSNSETDAILKTFLEQGGNDVDGAAADITAQFLKPLSYNRYFYIRYTVSTQKYSIWFAAPGTSIATTEIYNSTDGYKTTGGTAQVFYPVANNGWYSNLIVRLISTLTADQITTINQIISRAQVWASAGYAWNNVNVQNATGGSGGDYTLPQATANTLGGIKAAAKTANETAEVKIDTATGKLYVPAGGGSYTLPVADVDTLGGVMPVAKTSAMTQAVGVDALGGLFTVPSSGGGSSGGDVWRTVADITLTETSSPVEISLDSNSNAFSLKRAILYLYPQMVNADNVAMTSGMYFRNSINNVGWTNVGYYNAAVNNGNVLVYDYNIIEQKLFTKLYAGSKSMYAFMPYNFDVPSITKITLLVGGAYFYGAGTRIIIRGIDA